MAFRWDQVSSPPATDELEVTVIGPGFGECVIVHVGDGRWLIVDSCLDLDSGEPVALKYLEAIGVAPLAVEWIVSTHWHADHIAGLNAVVAACTNASFFCATVLQKREFVLYATQGVTLPGGRGDNTREFRTVLQTLRGRGLLPCWTQGGMTIQNIPSAALPIRIEALSPSNAEYTLFLDRIIGKVASKGQRKKASVATDPNLAAIALSVRWNGQSIILGADLVAHPDPARGWSAAVVQGKSLALPKADFIKVPHHGSEGAHSEEMWTELLVNTPVAAITPYCRGAKASRPPKRSDLGRISRLSSQAILTAPTQSGRGRNKRSPVSLGLAQHGIVMRALHANMGMARFRRSSGSNWKTEVFGRARIIPRPRR